MTSPDPLAPLRAATRDGPEGRWLAERLAEPPASLRAGLSAAWPSLARRFGRTGLAGRLERSDAVVDLTAWRRCDAAGLLLLEGADPVPEAALVDLYQHGDLEERTTLLRVATLRPLTDATSRLLDEAQRTNVVAHLEAACLDGNLLVRALDAGLLSRTRFDRLVLKVAFNDLPLARMFEVVDRPGADLTRMLEDLASEREAAGRGIWRDTARLAAGAPGAGTVARVLGGLEHGDAGLRLAAADAVARLRRPDLHSFVRARLDREARADVRAALERVLSPG